MIGVVLAVAAVLAVAVAAVLVVELAPIVAKIHAQAHVRVVADVADPALTAVQLRVAVDVVAEMYIN